MNYAIDLFKGVGPIKFGMTPDEVRRNVNAEFRSFRKTVDSILETDAFLGLGVHVHYNSQEMCEAVEFGGSIVPTFEGKPLLQVPFVELTEWIKSLDPTVAVHETGLTSKLLGFGIYMSSMDDWTELSEGVIVFEEGYYD